MKTWVNYHSHTNYCDGSHAPEAYIKEAIGKGHPAYGFSSHAPVPFTTDWNIADDQLENYISDIKNLKRQYASDIQIYLGLEIDFIPELAGRRRHILKDIDLDYFIGSIHFVDHFKSGEYWNIDTSLELFKKGLKEIFNNDIRKAATRFWEITRHMIEEDKPDVIGHLDKIKMFNKNNCYFSETDLWYVDQVELTLDQIKKSGCLVEINTRGYYRYGQPDLYPGEWIIKRLSEKDIPITINSDAHNPEEIAEGMAYAATLLKKLKLSQSTALFNGVWKEYPLSDKGIEF